jgi:hypothetical protein
MEKPSYYSIIPASVRYDKRLTANAKLLYAEITALTNMNGQCFATNDYFSKLYGVSKQSISSWIKNLVDCGYIKSEIIYKEGSKEIDKRYLTFLYDPIKENFNTPHQENFKDNNNNIFNNNLTDSNIIEAIEKWLAYKKEKKQKYTPIGLKGCIEKLERLSGGDRDIAMMIVDESISNGWSGLFPLKNNPKRERTLPPKKEQTVFIEDGKFYIDDTMQEYKDVLVGMDDISVENCWKWIYNNFYGQEVSIDFIRERLEQFKKGD